MRNAWISLIFGVLFFAVFCSGCSKKIKNGEVSVTTSQLSLDALNNSTGTITVNLSQATEQQVELWFESLGPDVLQFGSIIPRFLNDDSARIEASLGIPGVIDSPILGNIAHVTLPINTKSFILNVHALFDNFPKRAVTYNIKIKDAKNATIKSGSDAFTINIAQAPMVPVFNTEQLYLTNSTNGTSVFNLTSYTFVPNGLGQYNVSFNYSKASGNYPNQNVNFNFSNMTPVLGPHNYTSDDGLGTMTTNFIISSTNSSVRGNYMVMGPNATISYNDGFTSTSRTNFITCDFVLF